MKNKVSLGCLFKSSFCKSLIEINGVLNCCILSSLAAELMRKQSK